MSQRISCQPSIAVEDRAYHYNLNDLIFRILEQDNWVRQLGFFIINAESTYKTQMFQLLVAHNPFRSSFWRMDNRYSQGSSLLYNYLKSSQVGSSVSTQLISGESCLLRKSDCWNLLRLWKESYDPVTFLFCKKNLFCGAIDFHMLLAYLGNLIDHQLPKHSENKAGLTFSNTPQIKFSNVQEQSIHTAC